MSKKEQETIVIALVTIAIVIGILVYAIKQVQNFIDANSWMHIILAIIWFGVTFWMGFLTYVDIKENRLGWLYGLQNLVKPAIGIVTFFWSIQQTWKSLLNYPWLIYIPFSIICLVIIFVATKYLVHYLENRKVK
jgi:hypothetical protein